MQKKKWLLLLLIFIVVGCQMFVPAVTPTVDAPTMESTIQPAISDTPGPFITARPVSKPVDLKLNAWSPTVEYL